MLIEYGSVSKRIDVTAAALKHFTKQGFLHVPAGDLERAAIFTDVLPNTLKSIFINGKEFPATANVVVDLSTIWSNNEIPWNIIECLFTPLQKLQVIHQSLTLVHGNMLDEFPEQLMVANYLKGNERVLEIGGNVGRNSLVIATILEKKGNSDLVVLECDSKNASDLVQNRDANKLRFHVEPSALSLGRLVQEGWTTWPLPEDGLVPEGYTEVPTITLQRLREKYPIAFDTLVLDCEGAFYYILRDMPDILKGIRLIIVENDYTEIRCKFEVDRVLTNHGFRVDYMESGGWGPCEPSFYEVWVREDMV
jgi:FkbM family methyltransferase